jgi:HSP20 family protein
MEAEMGNLARYNAFDDAFGDLMKGFFVRPLTFEGQPEVQIKIDVNENDKAYSVHADIPGVKKDDIKVDIDGNTVSIRAEVKKSSEEKEGDKVLRSERFEGMAQRSFTLPLEIDAGNAVAKYESGVLDLTLPKKEGAGAKTLTVR